MAKFFLRCFTKYIMKILPIIQNNFINSIQPHSNKHQSNPIGLQYAYNLPCDTVSFGNKSENIETKNSQYIYRLIENEQIEEAKDFLDQLSPVSDREHWDWNPNYYKKSKEYPEGRCLMSKLIEKFTETSDDDENWTHLLTMISRVAEHPNFKIMNKVTGEDVLAEIIDTGDVNLFTDALEAGMLTNNQVIGEGLDFYIDYAENKDLQSMATMLSGVKQATIEENEFHDPEPNKVENTSFKEELKIRNRLKKYEIELSPTDPKTFDEVGGMFEAKKTLQDYVLKPWDKRFRQRIIDNNLNRPSGVLLVGEPGCGKTYLMKTTSAQTGYPLYEVNLANIGSSAAYSMQKEVQQLVDDLESLYQITDEPSILMFDEIDSIAMSRKNCNTDWKKDDINAILMAINNSSQRGIIVVGATNNPDNLDEAVKRPGRLDVHIEIGKPKDNAERQDIVEKILQNKPIAEKLLEHKAEMAEKLNGQTPAQISSILHKTCLNAIYAEKDYADMEDFDKCYEEMTRSRKDTKSRTVIKGFRD